MSHKIRVGVIFGGRSSEHEVSIVSAGSVMQHLDRKKYDVLPIGITKDGQWLAGEKALYLLKENIHDTDSLAILPPDPTVRGLLKIKPSRDVEPQAPLSLDVVFPVLHGPFGEDGTIQGMLELADIPYVGAAVTASALAMDKILQKVV